MKGTIPALNHEPKKLRGLIIPANWDEQGNVIAVALSTFDEEEYLIDKDDKGPELLPFLHAEVEVLGEVARQDGKLLIKIKGYRVLK